MKSLLLVASVLFAGCSKKAEEAPAETTATTSGGGAGTMSKGAGPVADLQAEYATDKSKKGQPIRLSGILLNFGAGEGGTIVTLIDRKTQKRPTVECFTKQDIAALTVEQFDKLAVEGMLAESATGRAEIRDCTVTKEP
jgi:hypothetical protein